MIFHINFEYALLERMKKLCEERNSLYEKQNELKGRREKLERSFVK